MPPELRPKALHLVYTFPYPTRSGYDLRVWHVLTQMQQHMDITIFSRSMRPLRPGQQKAVHQQPHIKSLNMVLPRPGPINKLYKGLRMLPSSYPIMAGGWYFPEMQRELTRLINTNDYDLIVLEGIWMSIYWPILQRCRARKVLNLYDLEEHALARQAEVLPFGLKRMLYRNGVRRMHHLENRLVREADHTWVVSEREKQELLTRSPEASIEVAPNGVDSRRITPLLPESDSKEILFVGSLKYLPNIDGLKFFIHDVMPLLQELVPDVVLRVVGRSPGPEIRERHAPPHIEITGEVDDLEPYYRQCALTVVPLRSGGGTRLKILESMAYGRPVVSTTLGAEGLELEPERDLLIADQPEALAESIARLLNDPQARNAMAERARRQVEQQYDWAAIAQRMMTTYHQMLNKVKPRCTAPIPNVTPTITTEQATAPLDEKDLQGWQ